MGKDTVIDVDSVSMVFNISKEKIDSIKEYAIKNIEASAHVHRVHRPEQRKLQHKQR